MLILIMLIIMILHLKITQMFRLGANQYHKIKLKVCLNLKVKVIFTGKLKFGS